jgi:hypothetical protein
MLLIFERPVIHQEYAKFLIRPFLRHSFTMLGFAVVAVCLSGAYAAELAGPQAAAGYIKDTFAAKQKYFGNIADSGTLGNAKTKEILASQFNALTAENR